MLIISLDQPSLFIRLTVLHNTTETLARNDCGRNQLARWEDKDMNQTTCYNYNKKDHYANQYHKPRKLKN